jgi:hypothetical protein
VVSACEEAADDMVGACDGAGAVGADDGAALVSS